MDEHSFETDPHTFGWDCFFNGGSESDNPHPAESADFKRWARGFYEAAAESADAHSCGANFAEEKPTSWSKRKHGMQTITPERDNRNKKLISEAFWWVAMARRSQLLTTSTPEERARYVKAQIRTALFVLFGMGVWIAAKGLFSSPIPPASSATFIPAGNVIDVQLHDTTFSSSTTVTTSVGTYQVRGGVSAAKGDAAKLKKTKPANGIIRNFLCLDSKIKSGCYELL